MRTRTRAAILAALAVATLALAAAALAANSAKIAVSTAGTATTLHISVPQTTDPIAVITIFVPAGYTANLSAAAGTTIGQVNATAIGHDVGLTLPLSGPVTADSPASHTADVCSPGTHTAVWNLNLSVAGQTLVLPLYVDPTSGAATALGAYQMQICLPPWDTPVGSPGRAFEGAQLLDASFSVNGIFTAPSAASISVWHTLFTPFTPDTGQVNLAGTFEARALVGTPKLTIKAAKKNGKYAVGGKLTEGGLALSGVGVTVLRGNTATRVLKVASAKTGPGGAWTSAGKLVGTKAVYFKAHATSTGCAQPLPATIAPGGCVSATLGAWAVDSPAAKLVP